MDAGSARRAGTEACVNQRKTERVVAIAGNPNVGKSTLFNAVTGMNQHTGNWAGKTVANACGHCETGKNSYTIVDIPGTYSLFAHSKEEEIARNFLCFGGADAVVLVCDGVCLERNLNLVLQMLELTNRVIVCVNLMDEAEKKGIFVDLAALKNQLGVPVLGTVARRRNSAQKLLAALDGLLAHEPRNMRHSVQYPEAIEQAAAEIEAALSDVPCGISPRFLSLRLLAGDGALTDALKAHMRMDTAGMAALDAACSRARDILSKAGISQDVVEESIVSSIYRRAEEIVDCAVRCDGKKQDAFDRRLDRILTGRRSAYPMMLLLLGLALFITIFGANIPSAWLARALNALEAPFLELLQRIGLPESVSLALSAGAYRVLALVVSVMLPPMAIFFPLFTLLEDAGYLPRVAYNLDRPFARCSACGKQALTMCMGFGCNAAGVIGCRIIDSPRERLIAILTNSFVPCNGRFAPPYKGKQKYGRVLTPKKKQSN